MFGLKRDREMDDFDKMFRVAWIMTGVLTLVFIIGFIFVIANGDKIYKSIKQSVIEEVKDVRTQLKEGE